MFDPRSPKVDTNRKAGAIIVDHKAPGDFKPETSNNYVT